MSTHHSLTLPRTTTPKTIKEIPVFAPMWIAMIWCRMPHLLSIFSGHRATLACFMTAFYLLSTTNYPALREREREREMLVKWSFWARRRSHICTLSQARCKFKNKSLKLNHFHWFKIFYYLRLDQFPTSEDCFQVSRKAWYLTATTAYTTVFLIYSFFFFFSYIFS